MLGGAISRAKDELVSPDDYSISEGDYWENVVGRVYRKYQEKLRAANALDFDDLIMVTAQMFRRHKQVLEKYQNRFAYLLVDEYQDTNMAQYVLVHLLARGSGNICVVGDEDQSIYAFRGATIRNILEFEKDFSGARIVKLEENYRSTKSILGAANSVIRNNTERKPKTLRTNKYEGEKVVLFRAANEREEARFVAETAARLSAQVLGLTAIARYYTAPMPYRASLKKNSCGGVYRTGSFRACAFMNAERSKTFWPICS